MRKILILAAMALAACRSGPPRPIDIDAGDMCSRCRMAISQTRYAAELVDRSGGVWKFDDIGCMVRYTEDHRLDPGRQIYFVMDYQTRHWLEADRAFYVRSAAIPTPMSGGIAAFQDRAAADAFARDMRGAVVTFGGLWNSKS